MRRLIDEILGSKSAENKFSLNDIRLFKYKSKVFGIEGFSEITRSSIYIGNPITRFSNSLHEGARTTAISINQVIFRIETEIKTSIC